MKVKFSPDTRDDFRNYKNHLQELKNKNTHIYQVFINNSQKTLQILTPHTQNPIPGNSTHNPAATTPKSEKYQKSKLLLTNH